MCAVGGTSSVSQRPPRARGRPRLFARALRHIGEARAGELIEVLRGLDRILAVVLRLAHGFGDPFVGQVVDPAVVESTHPLYQRNGVDTTDKILPGQQEGMAL